MMGRDAAPVLVTGATGNVGREVIRCLGVQGTPFVAGVTDPERARTVLGAATPLVRLDLRDPGTYEAALRGARGVFLLRPPPIADVRTTLNVLVDRAMDAGVRHVTFLSVDGADRQRWVPHHAVERHLIARGISCTLLRPGFFAQNLADAYLADLREDSRLYVPAGHGRVAFVDVRDVAEVAARSFVDPALRGQACTLTGAEAFTFKEVAALLSTTLGRTVLYEPASIPGYLLHLRRRRVGWGQALVQTVLHVGLRLGNAARVDPTLGRLLGRRARTVADYIRDAHELWEPSGTTQEDRRRLSPASTRRPRHE